jgi:hypothetical protein
MADSIYTLDPTAASNTALDSIAYGPNQLYHSNIDNLFRAFAAKLAQHVDDLGGVNTVGGTANALTATIASGITAYATGQLFWFKNTPGPNTTATTMNVNAIGDKEIRLQGDSALEGGEMLDNGYYGLLYDAAYDGAAGGFILLNPATSSVDAATTTAVLTGTSTTDFTTPDAIAALWEKGSNVASAGTVSLGEGGFFHITGTTTITDIDFATAKDGRGAWLEFDGILTLTHNATTLNLPGGANITTAAGDRCYVVQDSTDNVHVMVYQAAAASSTIVTPWVAYTPTFTSFGTVTSISIWSRRVGDTLEVQGRFTTGTVVASEVRMTLGFNGTNGGITADATKISALTVLGQWIQGTLSPGTIIVESGSAYACFGTNAAPATKATGSAVSNSTVEYVKFAVPITGW